MAWPLRRVSAKGFLINTSWNPLGSFRLFSWCVWPFQDWCYQTKPVVRPERRGLRADCMTLVKEEKKIKRLKVKGILLYSLVPVTDVLLVENLTRWAWIHYNQMPAPPSQHGMTITMTTRKYGESTYLQYTKNHRIFSRKCKKHEKIKCKKISHEIHLHSQHIWLWSKKKKKKTLPQTKIHPFIYVIGSQWQLSET